MAPPDFVKTRLCCAYAQAGVCKDGDRCGFAHGIQELRPRTNLLIRKEATRGDGETKQGPLAASPGRANFNRSEEAGVSQMHRRLRLDQAALSRQIADDAATEHALTGGDADLEISASMKASTTKEPRRSLSSLAKPYDPYASQVQWPQQYELWPQSWSIKEVELAAQWGREDADAAGCGGSFSQFVGWMPHGEEWNPFCKVQLSEPSTGATTPPEALPWQACVGSPSSDMPEASSIPLPRWQPSTMMEEVQSV